MNSPTININSYSNDCIKIYDIFMKFRCVFRNPNQHMDSTKKTENIRKLKNSTVVFFIISCIKIAFLIIIK
ncbi:hypothetical protein METSMIF1_03530 [Methanobrevibacter smithii DSM 2374]|uniref:Uncharacterized protein n=1 Tax=Methanobrevibacter smithii DSM 2374 TaxID=521002 RepID=D2ZRP7_METSM|nr:hypothetical protein METSMIF1_03530 [Methanobrevibacter smithii DSM 2374]